MAPAVFPKGGCLACGCGMRSIRSPPTPTSGSCYALSLELTDTGFDFSVLSEFRARLAESDAGRAVFDGVLRAAGEAGLVTAGRRQRTDSTHVPAATRDLSRLEFVVETLRAALNQIAGTAGQWLGTVAAPEWYDRYAARPEDSRFPSRWLQHHVTGAVINLARLDAWLTGRPLARTRIFPFAALRPAG
ncbi:transposase [Streptomyces sp. GC420]|uniref:transposase n=1 Tax=Streptomyces sp. GC420 TaxID=2697568 RepID=UPI00141522D4|nr:transposase [Streptomyces sp. GC420]NBM16269.1 hypothetical protein [Streptomyces sp. GC420]